MLYPKNIETKIGFDTIRTLIEGNCLCPLGKQRVEEMVFKTDIEQIRKEIRQTSEFVDIQQNEDFPSQNFFDVRSTLKHIRIEGTFLEVEELFDLQRSLQAIIHVVSFLKRLENDESAEISETDEEEETCVKALYPELYALSESVQTYPSVVKRIDQILDRFGNIKDTASPILLGIRRELAAAAGSVSRTLASIMKAAKNDGVVDKDSSPTMRDGRLVIPVVPAMKRKIRGIVHDESDTGRTVYIEPAEVVEANNHIRELEADERREIKRILMEFSQTIRPEIPEMLASYEYLADIDFIRAKALLALKINAIEPKIEERQLIDWSLAVHPLLFLKFQKEEAEGFSSDIYNNVNTDDEEGGKQNGYNNQEDKPKSVVPLDIMLNDKRRILLISGPNAGGKSVCLKTTGLLQYMLQCGLLIPVAKSSVAGIFNSIFIDIGDEQSMENDLSTYSSHLMNMKIMLRKCDDKSLVLIDEFGTGTEPQIGGAIAEAVLKRFAQRKTYGVITTHYQNLKELASETEGIVNGAMLYDRGKMHPLFQLQIGNPGSSFAVEIARKIGLPEDVIAEAADIVGSDYINADKYLQDIVRDKRYWENKRQNIHQHEKQMQQTIERYEQEIQKLHAERKEIIARAKQEAEEILRSSNAQIEKTIREIKEAQAEKLRTQQIRREHEEFKTSVAEIDENAIEEKIRRQMEKIKARREKKNNKEKGTGQSTRNTSEKLQTRIKSEEQAPVFTVGSYVRMKGQSTIGQIKKLSANEAQVAFGSIVSNIKIKQLEPAEKPKEEKRGFTFISKQTQNDIRDRKLNFHSDIDIRGMRADEALQTITYFIDDAIVAGVSRVRILHGTGTGVLKTLIRQYLGTVPSVLDYRDEHIQLGGAGITVVELEH